MSNLGATLYFHIRHHYPLLFFTITIGAALVLIANIVSFTATTGLMDAIGARETAHRIVAAKDGLFWSYRVWTFRGHATADVIPTRVYGYLQSTNRDGTINIQVAAAKGYQTQRVALADLQITNANGLAAIVAMRKQDPIDIDLYDLPSWQGATPAAAPLQGAVVWIENKPFNIDLITAGVAVPDKNPPTDIVDRAFAEYHWKIALNKH